MGESNKRLNNKWELLLGHLKEIAVKRGESPFLKSIRSVICKRSCILRSRYTKFTFMTREGEKSDSRY